MAKTKIILVATLVALTSLCILMIASENTTSHSTRITPLVDGSKMRSSNQLQDRHNIPTAKAQTTNQNHEFGDTKRANFEKLVDRWKDLEISLSGEKLLAAKKLLCEDAAKELEHTNQLVDFLLFLKDEGEGDLTKWLLEQTQGKAIVEANSSSIKLIASIDDPQIKNALSYELGAKMSQELLSSTLKGLQSVGEKSKMLTGYCVALAPNDPIAAVKAFNDLRPDGVDFTGMTKVMEALPPTADFSAISGLIADDSKTLSRNARKALLERWASGNPKAAADYIIANKSAVRPEQIEGVWTKWIESDPAAADQWLNNIGDGAHKDSCFKAEARLFTKSDPRYAWQSAISIASDRERSQITTEIYNEWKKIDPQSAEQAMKSLSDKGK